MQLKSKQIAVRLEPGLLKALEKEAKADGRTLANYIRMLLMTHQGRKKRGKL